jgi:hypothetical protein
MIINKDPLMIDIIRKYLAILFKLLLIFPIAIAVNRKGTAIPSEYIPNSSIPFPMDSVLVA